jgi:diguanylate cyclase (GGDEF)-like protein
MDLEHARRIAQELGLTPEEFQKRKDYLLLGEQDLACIREVARLLPEVPGHLFDSFYEHVTSFAETRKFLQDERVISRLKSTQTHYLQELLSGEYDHEYMLKRLAVGDIHVKLNIVPLWYIGAFSKYIADLYDLLGGLFPGDPKKSAESFKSVLKAVLLDIVLTLESYHYGKYLLQKELEELSVTDHLTRLYNTRKMEEDLAREIARHRRYGHPLSAIMADVDDFKAVNDRLGHLVGDDVLREVATIIKANVRAVDLAVRYGGEEFLVLCPDTGLDQAHRLAEKLRRFVEVNDFFGVGRVTLSLGVAQLAPDDDSRVLLERADRKLYEAKRSGKNRVCSDNCPPLQEDNAASGH